MNNQKKLISLLILLTLNLTAYSQSLSVDSIARITRWKAIRVAEIALTAMDCDDLQRSQQEEIKTHRNVERKADSIILIQERINQVNDSIQSTQERLIDNQKAQTECVEQELKKWKVGGITGSILLIIELVVILAIAI